MKFSLIVALLVILGVLALIILQHGFSDSKLATLSKAWQKQFPQFADNQWEVEKCNGVIAVTKAGAVDFGMTFYRISDKENIGQCSHWLSIETGPCKPPKEWTCSFPKNYRG